MGDIQTQHTEHNVRQDQSAILERPSLQSKAPQDIKAWLAERDIQLYRPRPIDKSQGILAIRDLKQKEKTKLWPQQSR